MNSTIYQSIEINVKLSNSRGRCKKQLVFEKCHLILSVAHPTLSTSVNANQNRYTRNHLNSKEKRISTVSSFTNILPCRFHANQQDSIVRPAKCKGEKEERKLWSGT